MISQDEYFIGVTLISVLLAIVLLIFLNRYRRDNMRLRETEDKLRQNEQELQSSLAVTERQAQELQVLNQVRTTLARELDLSALIRTVVEVTPQTFGYTQVSLYLLEGDDLMLQHQVGYDSVIERIPIAEGVSGRVVRTGQPIFLEDVREDRHF
jgi:putative methionine-R-sulfoxide reductase with GAF domain